MEGRENRKTVKRKTLTQEEVEWTHQVKPLNLRNQDPGHKGGDCTVKK